MNRGSGAAVGSLIGAYARTRGRQGASTPTIRSSALSTRIVRPTLSAPPNSRSLSAELITATVSARASAWRLHGIPIVGSGGSVW